MTAVPVPAQRRGALLWGAVLVAIAVAIVLFKP
jgi:hypothetical protein